MKKFLSGILSLFLSGLPALAGDIRSSSTAENLGSLTTRNYVRNPGAEKNLAYITDSSTILTRSTSSPIEGVAQFAIDASSTSQNVDWSTSSFQTGLKGQNCMFSLSFVGDASLYKMQVVQNSVVIADSGVLLNSGSNAQSVILNFSCGDNSNATTARLTSTGNGAAILVDSVYIGLASNIGNISQVTPWLAFTPTGSWSSNTTYTGLWRRVGDSMDVQVKVATSGAPTSAALTVNMPSGYTIDTAKLAALTAASERSSLPNSAGQAGDSGNATYPLTVGYGSTTTVNVSSQSAASASVLQGGSTNVTQANPFTFGASDVVQFSFTVPVVEFGSFQPAFQPSATADLLGTTFSSATTTCPQGSLPADGTAVSRTTYAPLFGRIGTTYGVGDGSTTFNVPNLSGLFVRYTGNQAINARTKTGPSVGSTQEDQMQSHLHGSVANATADLVTAGASSGYLRVSSATGASTGVPSVDGANGTPRVGAETYPSSLGQKACIWTVSQNAPLIIGSVVSKATGVTGFEYANIAAASSCTLSSNSAGMVSTSAPGGSECAVVFASGTFSATPVCTCSTTNGTVNRSCYIKSASTSGVSTQVFDSSSTNQNTPVALICTGAR